MSSLLYVANWKMNFTYQQTQQWCSANAAALQELTGAAEIVICPSFDALRAAREQLPSNVALGAQDCSRHITGAYTGQVCAQSLAELGCAFCIVGHSERRKYQHETDLDIAAKVERLLEYSVTPIICIGETLDAYEKKETKIILERQLDELTTVLLRFTNRARVIIAYEPAWAIGSGQTPTPDLVADIFSWLSVKFQSAPHIDFIFLYGGSVNEHNAAEFKKIPSLGGFLIGNASLDFQKFKNIVLS